MNLIVLTRHATVCDDRSGKDKEIGNCSIPLEWSLKAVNSKQYDHEELKVIAAKMDQLHFILAPKVIATIRQL